MATLPSLFHLTLGDWAPPVARWAEGIHHVTVDGLDTARLLFGTPRDETRRLRSEVFQGGLEARQRLPQGMHDRCEEYVFAGAGRPSRSDLAGLANHLPLHYKVLRYRTLRIADGETLDVTVERKAHWPELDELEEMYVFLHVEHLVLGAGARIVVRGNVFAMECGTLEADAPRAAADGEAFDIGILPTAFSVDRSTSANTGSSGQPGQPGSDGADGLHLMVEGSLFGPRLVGVVPPAGALDGVNGGDGAPGEAGQRGFNGGMCRLADLRVGQLRGFSSARPLRIFSQAGRGGDGGCGGAGGDGGNGGAGGQGVEASGMRIDAGHGGRGGRGGAGGDGGRGGSGGISSNIFVELPAHDHALVRYRSPPSEAGRGALAGEGGRGGRGGRGGVGVSSGNGAAAGVSGTRGEDGRSGVAGRDGRSRPGARMHLIPMTGCASKP